jgi:hypothetical protein
LLSCIAPCCIGGIGCPPLAEFVQSASGPTLSLIVV